MIKYENDKAWRGVSTLRQRLVDSMLAMIYMEGRLLLLG